MSYDNISQAMAAAHKQLDALKQDAPTKPEQVNPAVEKMRDVIAHGCGCHRECEEDADLGGYCGCRKDAQACWEIAQESIK